MPLINKRRLQKAAQTRGSMSHATSRGNEQHLAGRLGGRVTPGSGAGLKKGDIQIKGLARIEVKGTVKNSFSVTKNLLDKTDQAALHAGEIPVHVVQFINPQTGEVEDEQAIMRLSDLEALLLRIQDA